MGRKVCEHCKAAISPALEAWARDQAHRASEVDEEVEWTDVIVLCFMGLAAPHGLQQDVMEARNGVNECRKRKGRDLIVPYNQSNNAAQTDAGEHHGRPRPKLVET